MNFFSSYSPHKWVWCPRRGLSPAHGEAWGGLQGEHCPPQEGLRCRSVPHFPDSFAKYLFWMARVRPLFYAGFRIRRIALIWGCWIRIRIQIADPDPDPGGQKWPTKIEKSPEFHVFKYGTGCSLLRAEGFSCSLGVLYGGLGIRKLQFLIKKIEIKFPAINFFQF